MIDVLLGGGVLLVAVAVGWVVHLARAQMIGTTTVRALAVACALGLVIMFITDWPWELMSDFWADHSVVAGTISTVLLVGIVFLTFEDGERRTQKQVDETVTAAGLGGIVDHLVDVEVALALVSRRADPSSLWPAWREPSKPLRWLRSERSRLHRALDGSPAADDPRATPVSLPETEGHWREELVDQSVRRLLAAMRDWSPLISGSNNGVMVLIAISDIRVTLMRLDRELARGELNAAASRLTTVRQRLRVMAYFMETKSGAEPPRPEVLERMVPLPPPTDLFASADDHGRSVRFSHTWQRDLSAALSELLKPQASSVSSEADSST